MIGGSEKHAALVVGVNNATNLNLVVWNTMGTSSTRTSVLQGDGDGQWQWPARI